jgi:copper transport protein
MLKKFLARSVASCVATMSAFLLLGIAPSPASALSEIPNEVIASNPAKGATVTVVPTQIQLTFRNPLDADDVAALVVTLRCAGSPVSVGKPTVSANMTDAVAVLTSIPPSGLCDVTWVINPRSNNLGVFSFTLLLPNSATPSLDTPTETTIVGEVVPTGGARVEPRFGSLLGLIRIAEYLFVVAVFGGLLFIVIGWPEGVLYDTSLRFLRLSWIGAVVSMYFVLALSSMRASGESFAASLNLFAWPGNLDSGSGIVLLIRFALVVGSAWLVFRPHKTLDPATQVPAILYLLAMTATYGLTRVGQNLPFFTFIVGMIHAWSMGLWLGALALLSRAVLAGPGESDLVDAVRYFAKFSGSIIVVTCVTGALQIYLMDGSAIFTTGHGRLNVLQLIVTAAMIWIMMLIRAFVTGRLSRERNLSAKMAWRLRRVISVELAVGIVVLALTSWAVTMRAPKAVATRTAPTASYVFREELSNDRFTVILSLTPLTVGTNAMRVELLEPRRINNFLIRFTPQAPEYPGLTLTVPLTRPGAAVAPVDGGLTFPVTGVWNVELTGTTTTGDLEPLSTTITITDTPVTTTVAPAVTTVPALPPATTATP